MLQNTIIIQFKTSGGLQDYDRLIEIEESLIQGFAQNGKAIVDGHDSGSGTMNIFIFPTGGWAAAVEIIKAYLKNQNVLHQAIIIQRSKTARYKVVWPENFTGQFEEL